MLWSPKRTAFARDGGAMKGASFKPDGGVPRNLRAAVLAAAALLAFLFFAPSFFGLSSASVRAVVWRTCWRGNGAHRRVRIASRRGAALHGAAQRAVTDVASVCLGASS